MNDLDGLTFGGGHPQPPDVPTDPTGEEWRGPAGPPGPAGPAGGIPDAPIDTNTYGRSGAAWTQVLPLSGGTLAGPLVLAADPVSNLQAATKQYVDTQMAMSGVTKTDRSGAITLNNTAQSLMTANSARRGWSLQNKSTGNMWFNDLGGTASATANNSIYLPAGAYYESEPWGASVQAVSILSDLTGAQFVAKEW